MSADEHEICGEFAGEEGWFSAECQLPKGHDGDHCALVTWPQYDPVHRAESTPMSEAIARIWAPTVQHMLKASPLLHWTAEDSDE